jgi:hypothetical protein
MFLDRDGLMSLGAQWCGLFAVAVTIAAMPRLYMMTRGMVCWCVLVSLKNVEREFLSIFQCWRSKVLEMTSKFW